MVATAEASCSSFCASPCGFSRISAWPEKFFASAISGLFKKVGAALELDDHVIALVARLDLAHPARQHRLAVIDQADRVAQLLHLVHAVGGEHDRLALVLQLQQGLLQQLGVHRVEAAERLVHHDQPGIVRAAIR